MSAGRNRENRITGQAHASKICPTTEVQELKSKEAGATITVHTGLPFYLL
jgi:hypothetical protein